MRRLILNGSGTGGTGIFIQSGASNNVIEGCFIGTGVSITSASVNLVGGATTAERNVISGNGTGIAISGVGGRNTVQGNYIGTDVTGLQRLANGTGVSVSSSSNHVGGAAASLGTLSGNVIPGNTGQGVSLGGGIRQIVEGNLIGTDATGTNDLGNGTAGILLNVQNSVIGNTVVSGNNNVAFNGDRGVQHAGSGSTNNMICLNSIFSNAKSAPTSLLPATPLPVPRPTTLRRRCRRELPAKLSRAHHRHERCQQRHHCRLPAEHAEHDVPAGILRQHGVRPQRPRRRRILHRRHQRHHGCQLHQRLHRHFPVAVADAMLITATATDPTGNTSKFFACRTNVSTVVTPVCSVSSMLSTNQPGNARALTTTITTNGVPVANLTFTVNRTGANGALQTNLTTAGNGQATFSYTGQNTGTDFFLMAGAVGGTEFSCDATVVSINNNVAPQITCPGNITTNTTAGSCGPRCDVCRTATGTPSPVITYSTNAVPVTSPVTFPKASPPSPPSRPTPPAPTVAPSP